MYPFVRFIKEMIISSRMSRLGLTDTHISHHLCWPWDLDFWRELNNGRALTLYDLGRIPLAQRIGLIDVLRLKKWSLTIAGSSVRYRRRIRAFDKITMKSRALGWDGRFVYIQQSMWVRGEAASSALLRAAVTDAQGIVSTDRLRDALGYDGPAPVLPDWVQAWIKAEDTRQWPPAD